ncbi:PASTA domain-containing protein [Arabiibacter massiliensis]|uniref:PASTA domain-containing protein n=1 Tax=Arabiibacter massiliensis TaxID=1870985 RepID=UPI0009BC6398|nr:PASTA domain-containing protein [Arabiibacter massiliensis]
MICPHCHSENRDGARFCNECGMPLTGKIAELATAADRAEGEESAPAPEPAPDEQAVSEPEAAAPADEEPARPRKGARPGASGPLDPASLPVIDVAGVNVDENGNAFDFSPIGEEDAAERPEAARAADDLAPFVPKRPDDEGVAADLSGLDECLVDASYVPPAASWRSGDTMEMPRIDGAAAPKQKEFRAPDANEKKGGKGKAALIALLCLLAIGGAAAGVTYYLEIWGGKMLPDVVGMTQTDAVYALEGKEFAVRVEQVKSDDTEGVVLSMEPGAGARQEQGTEVLVRVATARVIPEGIVGRQRDEAVGLLEDEGFGNVSFKIEKSNEREGVVLAVDPAPGSKALSAAPITVTVSQAYVVPDVAGKTWDEAKAALEAEGYVAQDAYVYDDSVAAGTVLGTDPAPGEKLASGSTVTVNIALSRAAELEAAALAYLQGAGTITLGDTAYAIDSVDAVAYQGSETTSFTITGRAMATLDGETVYGSAKQKSGSIVWDASNNVVSIS